MEPMEHDGEILVRVRTRLGDLTEFDKFMLSYCSSSVLDYILDKERVVLGKLTRADVWTLHLLECSRHGKSCLLTVACEAVRCLQVGEAGADAKVTRDNVRRHLKSIAPHRARKNFVNEGASAAAIELAKTPFRLRAATVKQSTGASPALVASSAAPGHGAAGVASASPTLNTTLAAAASPPPPKWLYVGALVKVLRRAGPYINPPKEEALAVVNKLSAASADVSYLPCFNRRPELDVALEHLAESDVALTRRREIERSMRTFARARRDVVRLRDAEARSSSELKKLRDQLAAAQKEVKSVSTQFESFVRGGDVESGSLTAAARAVVARIKSEARSEVALVERSLMRAENQVLLEQRKLDSVRRVFEVRLEEARADVQHQRDLKNRQAARARKAEAKAERLERRLARADRQRNSDGAAVNRLPLAMRETVERAQLHEVLALERADELAARLKSLEANAASKLKVEGASLLQYFKPGVHKYPLEVLEYGLELMGRGLSAEQARGSMRALMHLVFPNLSEGNDYSIMSAWLLNRLRRCLKPLMAVLALERIRTAERWHLIHDATSKRGDSIFAAMVRVELEDGTIEEFPLDSEMLTDGDSRTEADAIMRFLAKRKIGGVLFAEITLRRCASASSDDAAAAVKCSKEIAQRQRVAFDEAQREWLESGGDAAEFEHLLLEVLSCSGHQLHLISDASHKLESVRVLTLMKMCYAQHAIARLYRQRIGAHRARVRSQYSIGALFAAKTRFGCYPTAAGVVDVPDLVHCIPKLLSNSGRDREYHLSEYGVLTRFVLEMELPALVSLPSVKGSRQMIGVELCAAIVRNIPQYLAFLDSRILGEPSNKLLKKIWGGLSDRYAVAALLSRAAVFVLVVQPARFLLSAVERPQTRRLFNALRVAIRHLPQLDSFEVLRILAAQILPSDAARARWAAWEAATAASRDAVRALFGAEEHTLHVRYLLRSSVEPMLATLARNVDADMSQKPAVAKAPTGTDFVESYFGNVDYWLRRLGPTASLYASAGVASASMHGAFRGAAERAERERRRHYGKTTSAASAVTAADGGDGDLMAFRRIPRERRELMLRHLLSVAGFKEHCVDPENAARAAQREETNKRRRERSEAADQRARRAAAAYALWNEKLEWVRSVERLRELVATAGGDQKLVMGIYRDQIRYRHYVLGISWTKLPKLGESDLEQQRTAAEKMIASEPADMAKPPPPSGDLAVRARAENATKLRAELDAKRAEYVAYAREELRGLNLAKQLRLQAGGALPPLVHGALPDADSVRRQRRRRGGRANAAAAAAAADAVELVGAEFVDDALREYKVLDVYWSAFDNDAMVLYYDPNLYSDSDEVAITDNPRAFDEGVFVSPAFDVVAWARERPVHRAAGVA